MAVRQRCAGRAPGRHEVHFYDSVRQQAKVAAAHLAPALTAGTPVVMVADPAQSRRIDAALVRAGHDVAAAREDGLFVRLSPAQVGRDWMRDGKFDASAWQGSVGALVRDLSRRGQVRCYGAAVGALWTAGRIDDVAGIERAWAEVCKDESVSMLCGYPVELFVAGRAVSGLAQICHAHDAVLAPVISEGIAVEEELGRVALPAGEPSIAAALRRAREDRGWSREDLAHHSGVSYGAIAQIETGRRTDVRLRSLVALADALGVSVDALLGRDSRED